MPFFRDWKVNGVCAFTDPGEALVIPQAVKAAVRSAAGRAYAASPRFSSDLAGKVLILMYHRVVPRSEVEDSFVQPGMYVTPETFESHLRFLTAHFELLAFDELVARWDDGIWDPSARYCTITFDDGWLDNYRYAYPLLRSYGVPASIFLPTDLVGTDRWLWSDRLGCLLHRFQSVKGRRASEEIDSIIEHAKTLPDAARERFILGLQNVLAVRLPEGRRFLNWDEAREMSRHRIEFGSHSCTHAILPRLAGAALERELRRPLDMLDEQGVNRIPVLGYPNGDHDDVVVDAARTAGYQAAVTTRPGAESTRPADLLRLRRIGVHEDVSRSVPLFMFHIARQVWPSSGVTG
jgi:peptidoglycan/xylan/chitin deacetylase (PgdA/CDA1 family)